MHLKAPGRCGPRGPAPHRVAGLAFLAAEARAERVQHRQQDGQSASLALGTSTPWTFLVIPPSMCHIQMRLLGSPPPPASHGTG